MITTALLNSTRSKIILASSIPIVSYYTYETDVNLNRTISFWSNALPAYASYRAIQRRNEFFQNESNPTLLRTVFGLSNAKADEEYEKLHDYFSPIIEKQVNEQRGFYIKHAQFLSTRDDFLPEQYLRWTKLTQDKAPTAMKRGEAREIVKESLRGSKYEDEIEWFDDDAVGVASIGAVHRCKLKSFPKPVIVKVQADEVEGRFRNDVGTMILFLQIFQPQHVPPLKEVQRRFMEEFDYRVEAKNLRDCKNMIDKSVFRKRVKIPEPIEELCSKRVLFMEEIEGVPLVKGVQDSYKRFCDAQKIDTVKSVSANEKGDDSDANKSTTTIDIAMRQTRRVNAMIRLKSILIDEPMRLAYNLSPMRILYGKRERKQLATLVNLADVLQTMLDVHAYQIFECGVFNGDPHPGNILLMNDGRLGLIDYGQTVRIPEHTRLSYAKLILAILNDDKQEVANIVWSDEPKGFGGRTKNACVETAFRLATFWNDRDTKDITEGMNLQAFIDEMEARDPMIETPRQMVMISRASVLLRGMGNAFDMRIRVAEAWREHAVKLLKSTEPDYYLLRSENEV